MHLKTKLDWQGYKLAAQNEETMGCSPEQTAMCVAISEYREQVHKLQEAVRKILPRLSRTQSSPGSPVATLREFLADYSPPDAQK